MHAAMTGFVLGAVIAPRPGAATGTLPLPGGERPAGASPAALTMPELEAAGWRHAAWKGIAPARWRALSPDGVAVEGQGQGSFLWRALRGAPGCLAWRWRVEAGPPGMDLTRRGSDRAIFLALGFSGWPPRAGLWQRSRHALAQSVAGDHPLPRSVLFYVWGGTGQEPALFQSPYLGGFGAMRVLRPASAPRGRWFEERVDLAADWRAAFGADPPPLQEIAIGSDGDDTRSRIEAAVEAIRLGCG